MKNRVFTFVSLMLLFFTILAPKVAKADEIIKPVNKTYNPGIYILDKSDKDSYNLMYEFQGKNEKSAIIILDGNYDIVYKNINCNRRCNAGTITNKSTIIIVGGEVDFYFTKL